MNILGYLRKTLKDYFLIYSKDNDEGSDQKTL